GPHEGQELPRALVAGDRGEGEAVALGGGQRGSRLAQLVPRRRRGDARLLEGGGVVEQRDGVHGGRDAVQRVLVHAEVGDRGGDPLGAEPVLLQRGQRAGGRDLLDVGVVEHQQVRQGARGS